MTRIANKRNSSRLIEKDDEDCSSSSSSHSSSSSSSDDHQSTDGYVAEDALRLREKELTEALLQVSVGVW